MTAKVKVHAYDFLVAEGMCLLANTMLHFPVHWITKGLLLLHAKYW